MRSRSVRAARERRPRRRLGVLRLLPSPARAGALLGVLAGVLVLYGLTTASAFAVRRIQVSPLTWTDKALLVRTLAVDTGGNAFRMSTASLANRLLQLPAVAGASISVALPDTLVVDVRERVPVVAWRVNDSTFVVDSSGAVFAFAPPGLIGPSGARLPLVVDTRQLSDTVVGIGSTLDPTDLDAATRLASLTPADLGSDAASLVVRITDDDGWVITTNPGSWVAVFGPYTPVARTPDLIPAQVRLLRSLLSGREATVARVVLADGEHGTYLPLASGGG